MIRTLSSVILLVAVLVVSICRGEVVGKKDWLDSASLIDSNLPLLSLAEFSNIRTLMTKCENNGNAPEHNWTDVWFFRRLDFSSCFHWNTFVMFFIINVVSNRTLHLQRTTNYFSRKVLFRTMNLLKQSARKCKYFLYTILCAKVLVKINVKQWALNTPIANLQGHTIG